MDSEAPALIGACCKSCGSYYFPKGLSYCKNPDCEGREFDELPLSRRGRIWSYTDACYQPPEPYVAADPFVPFAIAAVELEKEQMIILGQMVAGVPPADITVGQEVELVLDVLHDDADGHKMIWKWKPL